MNAIAKFRKCTLTDTELLVAVDEGIDDLYKTGKIPPRHIPARPNSDFDLLVGELMLRLDEKVGEIEALTKKVGAAKVIIDLAHVEVNGFQPEYKAYSKAAAVWWEEEE